MSEKIKKSLMPGRKLKIAVLFGGRSTEHAVSCVSAVSIIKNLDKNKYDIVPIGITTDGDWLPYSGSTELLPADKWVEPARAENGFTPVKGKCSLELGIKAMSGCDCVLPVLHGQNGEDGTVQGLLELMGLPYVGCGIFASAAGMDKVYTKLVLEKAGIPQAEYIVSYRPEALADPEKYVAAVNASFGFPCFVKPSNSGSSVGVFKVKTPEELPEALRGAHKYDRKVLIEEFIDGREIECAVLGNYSNAVAAAPGEIKPSKEFYDYEDKYESGASYCVIPAELPEETMENVRATALKAFAALDGTGLSRVDFFCKKDGSIVLNEINTLPGFTEISMYSKLWINAGMTYSALLDRLVELAFERVEENKRCMK